MAGQMPRRSINTQRNHPMCIDIFLYPATDRRPWARPAANAARRQGPESLVGHGVGKASPAHPAPGAGGLQSPSAAAGSTPRPATPQRVPSRTYHSLSLRTVDIGGLRRALAAGLCDFRVLGVREGHTSPGLIPRGSIWRPSLRRQPARQELHSRRSQRIGDSRTGHRLRERPRSTGSRAEAAGRTAPGPRPRTAFVTRTGFFTATKQGGTLVLSCEKAGNLLISHGNGDRWPPSSELRWCQPVSRSDRRGGARGRGAGFREVGCPAHRAAGRAGTARVPADGLGGRRRRRLNAPRRGCRCSARTGATSGWRPSHRAAPDGPLGRVVHVHADRGPPGHGHVPRGAQRRVRHHDAARVAARASDRRRGLPHGGAAAPRFPGQALPPGARRGAVRERNPAGSAVRPGSLDSQPGRHQHRSPSRVMAAGRRTPRTTVASSRMAAARPTPSILSST